MDRATPLDSWQYDTALKMLRVGATPTEAAEMIEVPAAALYAVARNDTDLLLALAGHDPYARGSRRKAEQAQYIGLLALGLTPTQASRVLFHGDERVKEWRAQDRDFAQIADGARVMNPPPVARRREHRFSPDRVRVFLDALRGGSTVVAAAEEAGVTNATIYQRRRRDKSFRDAMDAARAAARERPRPETEFITEDQWVDFRRGLEAGMTLRRSAIGADIHPQRVYDRRRHDPEFRLACERWRRG